MFRHTHIFLRCVSVRAEWTKVWDDLYMRWHEEQGTLNGKALSKHREGSVQVKILKLGLFSVEVWLCVCLSNCVQHWRDFCQISLPTLLSCLMLQPWEGALSFLILQLWYCHRQISHQVGYSCWNPFSPNTWGTLCKNAWWRRKEALGGMAAFLLGATQMTLPGRSCMTVHIQEGAVLLAYHDWISPWVCTIQRSQYLLGGCQGKAQALQDSWTRRLLGKYLVGRVRGAFFCAIE